MADEYVILGLDDVGDDLVEDVGDEDVGDDLVDDLGAPARRRRRARVGRGRQAGGLVVRRRPSAMPLRAGVKSGLALQQTALGFDPVFFTAASGTSLSTVTSNSKPFQGRKLVVDIARVGATASGLVSVASLKIGTDEQLPATKAVPATTFNGTVQGDNMVTRGALAYEDFTVLFKISLAPTAPDVVTVQAGLNGQMVA